MLEKNECYYILCEGVRKKFPSKKAPREEPGVGSGLV